MSKLISNPRDLDKILGALPTNLPEVILALKKIVDYINDIDEPAQNSPSPHAKLITLGRGRDNSQSVRKLKRDSRRDFFRR